MGLESRLELLKKPDIEIRDTPTYLRAMERANRFDLIDGSVATWIGQNLSYVAQHYPELLQFQIGGKDLLGLWESPHVTVHVSGHVVHEFDGTGPLQAWARYAALSVKDKWPSNDPLPAITERYLRTGDESIRKEAQEAAWKVYWAYRVSSKATDGEAYWAYRASYRASYWATDSAYWASYWASYWAASMAIRAEASESELLAQLRRMLLESLQGKAEWSWK